MIHIRTANKKGYCELSDGGVFDATYVRSTTRRGRVQGVCGDISPTITAQGLEVYRVESTTNNATFTIKEDGQMTSYRIRKLTPKECLRLMGVNESDADKMLAVNSNTQCYKQAGNSIVVDVMAAMFKNIFEMDDYLD